jgi:hypothetical protein
MHSYYVYSFSNHYALIHGVRDWRNEDGEPVREVLTARKGQRPSAWIDFNEIRELMIRVQSYKMIVVRSSNKQKKNGNPLGIYQR